MNREIFRKVLFRKVSQAHFRIVRIFLFILFITFINRSYSQVFEVGLYGGDSYYLGDLNPGLHFSQAQVAYGALIRYNLDTRWSVKLSGYRGKIKGNSSSSTFLPDNGLSFESPITDISGVIEFNFFDYFTGSKREFITPYIYTGFGFFFYNPTSGGTSLRDAGTEGQNTGYEGRKPYGGTSISIPFGVGVKYSLGKRLCMTIFWEMHKTFTDYLDDVSKTYYLNGRLINPNEQAAVLSDPTMNHEPGMQRGNTKNMDWYSFSGITLTYQFKIKASKKCRDLHHN
jgi:hypothetical protein